jgi:hypothetical protein
MSLSIQKLSACHSAKNVLITIINSSKINKINIFEPIPIPNQNKNFQSFSPKYEYFNNANYSIAEIPPPYCSVCNKFMTTNQCSSMIQPKTCPLL